MSALDPSQFGTPPDLPSVGVAFARLCEVIAKLRSPTGCPWDRQQTLETIKSFTLEETYELLEAIDSKVDTAIVEELGDVLLQVVLDAQIGRDEQRFGIEEVIDVITQKMIARHPHVFDAEKAHTADEVLTNWDRAKQCEKKRDSIFDGLPAALPALARCARVSEKAARVGYDFPHRAMLFDKLREEIDELAHELFTDGQIPQIPASVEMAPVPDEPITDPAQRDRIESEFGDVLFVVANLARRWKINPEEALRRSNAKFERRVRFIEEALKAQGRSIRDATLIEMEELYQAGKRKEPKTDSRP
ncbi:MAG: nucleoside triphosphate pyrophosphohydrolase [Planctomycetes bacterium]|nr:nucleoside triphosphate pyrophosphohydrolase [Planctomycetota bacterium]